MADPSAHGAGRSKATASGLAKAMPKLTQSRSQAGAAVDGATLAELNEAMNRLTQAVDAMRLAGIASRGEGAALVAPRTAPDPAELEAFTRADIRSQAKPYLLNTYQQVVDRFGMPDDVAFNESAITWIYRTKAGGVVYFTFAGGLLANSRCDDPRR